MINVARALLALVVLAGCDQDRFLSGQWTLQQPEIGDESGLDTGVLLGCTVGDNESTETCERWLELNLGHFGEQVVGTLRFYDSPNRIEQKQSVCSATNRCACQYIDARLRNDELIFEYSDCAGTVRDGLIRVIGSSELEWVIDSDAGAAGAVRLVPGDTPTSSDKVCVPECQ